MNQDDIIRMAREVGCRLIEDYYTNGIEYSFDNATLERFAALVAAAAVSEDNIIKRNAVRDELTMSRVDFIRLRDADRALARAAEREKCAKKCESYIAAGIGKEMADAIRAMSNE
jgi:hypothetical protein